MASVEEMLRIAAEKKKKKKQLEESEADKQPTRRHLRPHEILLNEMQNLEPWKHKKFDSSGKRRYHVFEDQIDDESPVKDDAPESSITNQPVTPSVDTEKTEIIKQKAILKAENDRKSKTSQNPTTALLSNDLAITEQLPSNNLGIAEQSLSADLALTEYSVTTQKVNTEDSLSTHLALTEHSVSTKLANTEPSLSTKRALTKHSLSPNRANTKHSPSTHQANTEPSVSKLLSINSLIEQVPKGVKLVDFLGEKQAKILAIIFKSCVQNQSRISSPIPSNVFMAALGGSSDSIANRISHMKKKGLVLAGTMKTGKGGWATYELPELVYKTLAEQGTDITEQLLSNYLDNYQEKPSRLDKIRNKSNLSNLGPNEEQAEATKPVFDFDYGDWDDLDLGSVSIFGFRKEKLMADVKNQKLEIKVWELQDMVDRFPQYHASLKTKPNNPFGAFMSLVRRKAIEKIDALAGFKTQTEVDAENALAESLRLESERRNQLFISWEQTMGEGERYNFVREKLQRPVPEDWTPESDSFRGVLFQYFLETVLKTKSPS